MLAFDLLEAAAQFAKPGETLRDHIDDRLREARPLVLGHIYPLDFLVVAVYASGRRVDYRQTRAGARKTRIDEERRTG